MTAVALACVCVCVYVLCSVLTRTRHIVDTIECAPWLNGHTMGDGTERDDNDNERETGRRMNDQHVCVVCRTNTLTHARADNRCRSGRCRYTH